MLARTRRSRKLLGATTLAVVALVAVGAALAASARRTTLLSVPAGAAPANGESANASFSQDERIVRLVAFDSAASNLVAGDANQRRDVFALRRGRRQGDLGGTIELVSARDGVQADGDSQRPSVDGERGRSPRCIAFESTATNLDPANDRTPDWDVYVRDLRSGAPLLVSHGVAGDATNGTIDGRCEYVTFEASGSVYVRSLRANATLELARGTNPDMQTNGEGAAYERGGQIFHRAFGERRRGVLTRGRERLVSRGQRGRGNGASRNPVADEKGYYVAFESDATNLCSRSRLWCSGVSRDRGGNTDIFRATISRRAPTRDRMQMASYSHGIRAQGNADSREPAMSAAGEFVFFSSLATNLRESRGRRPDTDDHSDVYLWNFPRKRGFGNVSRESRPTASGGFNGASLAPATSARGNYIAFSSIATDPPGANRGSPGADVFIRFLGGR